MTWCVVFRSAAAVVVGEGGERERNFIHSFMPVKHTEACRQLLPGILHVAHQLANHVTERSEREQ